MVRHDIRLTLRSLGRSWGFTLLAVVSLAIGLGANTALFSLVDALLLRSLPVADPARLVLIQRTAANGKSVPIDLQALDVIRGVSDVYADAALSAALPSAAVSIDHAPEPARQVFAATPTLFSTLGVGAEAGQLRTADGTPVAVISDRYWHVRFGRDRSVIGRPIVVNGAAYPIVGIAAHGFLGVSLDSAGDVWLLQPQFRAVAVSAIARLRRGISIEQAASATAGPLAQADLARPGSTQGRIETSVVRGVQGTSNLRERYRAPLVALMGLVALVLVVTCANLANLLAIRNANRAHELHVRTALGAGRAQLIRQLLAEGLVIAMVGATAAWFCAKQMVTMLLSTLPSPQAASRLALQLDARMLGFMAVAALLTTVAFALLPAWRASRIDASAALRTTPAQAGSRGARRLGLMMVGVQVALSVVLLTGAVMFTQTVRNVAKMPLGFDRNHLIEVELADRVLRVNAAQTRQIHDSLLDGIGAIPGVEHVALSLPLFPAWAFGIEQPDGEGGYRVSADYFATMKIPLIRGRLLTNDDLTRQDPVVVVDEWYARGWFPGQDALGKRGGFNNGLIVGIVGNAITTNVRWETPTVYRLALPSEAHIAPALIIRSAPSLDPVALFGPIEQVVRGVNPGLLVAVRTPDEALNRSIARERMVAATSGFFGIAGLVLAGIGLFGVAGSAVTHRTRELGVRAALGATRWTMVREALRGTSLVFAAGLAAGVAATFVLARQLDHIVSGMLIGLRATDWLVVAAAATAMLAVATLAAILPALQAARVDPLIALRAE